MPPLSSKLLLKTQVSVTRWNYARVEAEDLQAVDDKERDRGQSGAFESEVMQNHSDYKRIQGPVRMVRRGRHPACAEIIGVGHEARACFCLGRDLRH